MTSLRNHTQKKKRIWCGEDCALECGLDDLHDNDSVSEALPYPTIGEVPQPAAHSTAHNKANLLFNRI